MLACNIYFVRFQTFVSIENPKRLCKSTVDICVYNNKYNNLFQSVRLDMKHDFISCLVYFKM